MIRTRDRSGVGGWLLLLCLLLIAWGPLALSLVLANAIAALPERGAPLGALIVVRLGAAAFGVASGLALLGGRGPALRMARASLIVTAATDTFVYLTSYFPSNRMPGDDWYYVAGTVLYATAWLAYLARSRRVKNTFA